MKAKMLLAALPAVLCLLWAANMADVPAALKLSEKEAQEMVLRSLVEGYLDLPREACKKVAADRRPEIVKAMGAFAKQYAQSALFKSQYAEYREGKKPSPNENEGFNAEEEQAQNIAEMKKALAEAEQQLKTTTDPNLRSGLQMGIQAMRDQLKMLQNMSKEEKAMMQAHADMAAQEQKKQQAQDLAEFEQEYPADHKKMIKKRLKEFIAMAKTVDFNAQLVEKYGKKRFVNAAYEAKPSEWKLMFRAGKPTVDAGVAFASQWLQELEQAK